MSTMNSTSDQDVFASFTFNTDNVVNNAIKATPPDKAEDEDSLGNITKIQKTLEPTTPDTVISFKDLTGWKKNLEEIARFKDALERRGWCLFALEEWDTEEIKRLFNESQAFFGDATKEDKLKYRYPPDFGYSSTGTGFKEGFKVLTGDYIHNTVLPPNLGPILIRVCERLDSICHSIAAATVKGVFGSTTKEILEKEQIPLMNGSSFERDFFMTSSDGDDEKQYGMFDIAHYTNESTEGKDGDESKPKREKNVVAHGDPGIYSISLGSTAPGLEMFDPETEKWIGVKNDQLVFWNGAAAQDLTEDRLKTGIHRVTYGDKSRLTMWYEACALDQIPESVRKNGVTTTENIERLEILKNEKGFSIKVDGISSWRMSRGELITLEDIKPSMTIYEVMLKITEIEGLPPSKMMLSANEESKRLKAKAHHATGVYGDDQLEHDKLVSDYNIKSGDIISMLSSRRQAPAKKKKMKGPLSFFRKG